MTFLSRKFLFSIFFAACISLGIGISTQSNDTYIIKPAQESSFKAIVFDVGGVLLTTKSWTQKKVVLQTIATNPSLLYRLLHRNVKEEYFNFLHEINEATPVQIYSSNQALPPIFCNWLLGAYTSNEMMEKLTKHADNIYQPTAIKNLYLAIARFMFTPEIFGYSQTPIHEMVALAQNLKDAGYKIYALTNWDSQSFNIVKTNNCFFDIFDGIVVSGEEQDGKPAISFFNTMLKRFNIDPKTAIFIDDEKINTDAAQRSGIDNVVNYVDFSSCLNQLENLGIVLESDH